MKRFKQLAAFGSKYGVPAAVIGGTMTLVEKASATTTPDPLVDWTAVTADIKASLSAPAGQAVIIGGLILAAVLGWALIKRFAR